MRHVLIVHTYVLNITIVFQSTLRAMLKPMHHQNQDESTVLTVTTLLILKHHSNVT